MEAKGKGAWAGGGGGGGWVFRRQLDLDVHNVKTLKVTRFPRFFVDHLPPHLIPQAFQKLVGVVASVLLMDFSVDEQGVYQLCAEFSTRESAQGVIAVYDFLRAHNGTHDVFEFEFHYRDLHVYLEGEEVVRRVGYQEPPRDTSNLPQTFLFHGFNRHLPWQP